MNKTTKHRLQNQAKMLHHLPGVYQMLDKDGKIIYVGKSIDVNRRVLSYFNASAKRSKKITRMIHHIDSFRVFYTDTELDALLLECKWIKQYKPFYNTALTRQHKYVYLELYDKECYAIKVSKEVTTEDCFRLGPFTNHRLALAGIQYVRQSQPYFNCEFKYKNKIDTCYPYQFKACPGVCIQEQRIPIQEIVEQVLGKESGVLEEIDKKIADYVEYLEFERAAELLRQRRGVQYLSAIYQLLQSIKEQENYIGVLPLEDCLMNKYYLVKNSKVIATQLAYKSEQKEVLKVFRKMAKKCPIRRGEIAIHEIDEILIMESFRRGKMKVYKV